MEIPREMVEWLGIIVNMTNSGTSINCCSLGELKYINWGGPGRSGIVATSGCTHKNCYYLDGVPGTTGLTAPANVSIFYKTTDDPNAMTTAKVVTALNNYIELKGVLNEGDTEVDTTGWCKWVIGDNNLPALDFDTEWNGTEWVETNN